MESPVLWPEGKRFRMANALSFFMTLKLEGVCLPSCDPALDAYIAAGSDQWRKVAGHTLFGKGQFVYDEESNTYACPAYQILPWNRRNKESVGGSAVRTVEVYQGDRATCGACPLKAQCLTPKKSFKVIKRGPDDEVRDSMKAKVRSVEGDAIYRTRKGQVEPAFGIIKETLGFRQFSLRGETKVRGEWALVCLTYNLRKIGHLLQKTGELCTIENLRTAQAR